MNMLLYQILTSSIYEKIQKSHTKTINLEYQFLGGVKILNP